MVRPTAHRIYRLHSGEGEWIKVDTGSIVQTVLKAGNIKIIRQKSNAWDHSVFKTEVLVLTCSTNSGERVFDVTTGFPTRLRKTNTLAFELSIPKCIQSWQRKKQGWRKTCHKKIFQDTKDYGGCARKTPI